MPQSTATGTTAWPADFAARYVARGYWEGRSLLSYIRAAAEATPAAVCLVDGDVRMTYQELMARVDGAGARLHRLGLRPDDRILVQLPNCWEFFVVVLGCLRAGMLPVLTLQGHRKQEIAQVAEHAEARAIVTVGIVKGFDHQALAHEVAGESRTLEHVLVAADQLDERSLDLAAFCRPAEHPEPAGEEPEGTALALFVLSGGSTGAPKLIGRTHNDFSYMVRRAAQICGVDRDTVYLTALPLGHGFPFTGALGALFCGGRVVITRSPVPQRAFAVIEAERVTMTSLVPAIAQRWLDHRAAHPGQDIASLALVQVSGSRIPDEMARRIKPVLGCSLQNGYGMGEGLMCLTRPGDPAEVVCGTQGRPICPDDELMLVDEQGAPVPDGEAGILLTRGPYTPRGYYRAEQANALAFNDDGWYNTGDIVRRRPDGNLVVEGRQKDVINRGGEKISAEEIENFAYQSGASLAAAVAMPDAELGERICLYVVGGRIDLNMMRSTMLAAGVAVFKLPERLVLAESLPVTAIGKIDKKALRADIADRIAHERVAAQRDAG
ncbi:AMP-binding protein [Dactylosporangium sp. NPDC051484]|uniref:(2,3-dihydroxybenzoyl)adenylate synthase n=1 Tax=Dactylosporangium sp. NPDC051484 TaxID=3154942 RepID=UPI003450358D